MLGDLTASGAGPSAMRAALQFPDRPKPPPLDESGGSAGDGLPHSSGTLLGRFTPEEPAAEGAKEKSNFGGEREIGGHADENAEHQPSDRTDPDCGSGTQGAHPIDHAPAFHAERGFRPKERLDWLLGSSIRSIKVVPRVFAVVASGHPPRSQCTQTEGPRWPQAQ